MIYVIRELKRGPVTYLKKKKKPKNKKQNLPLIFFDVQASSYSGLFQVEFCFLEEGDSLRRNFE